jgi:hypothetical protein
MASFSEETQARVGKQLLAASKHNHKQAERKPETRVNLHFLMEFDEGGAVNVDDDECEPIKLTTGPCDRDSGY